MGRQFRQLDAACGDGLFPDLCVRTYWQGALHLRHSSLWDFNDGHLSSHEVELDTPHQYLLRNVRDLLLHQFRLYQVSDESLFLRLHPSCPKLFIFSKQSFTSPPRGIWD